MFGWVTAASQAMNEASIMPEIQHIKQDLCEITTFPNVLEASEYRLIAHFHNK